MLLKNEFSRRIIVSMFLVTAASMISHIALAAGFIDTDGTKYQTAFNYLQNKGAVKGYPDGLAYPNLPLKRVEALKVMLEVHGGYADRIAYYENKRSSISLFSDTDQTQWYIPYLETGFEAGIAKGYPDGTFRPGQFVRVEEAVAMLIRMHGEDTPADTATLSDYIENRQGEWFTGPINTAIARNLIMNDGRMRLGTAITRGQFFDMVYRLDYIQNQNIVAYDGPEPGQPIAQPSVQPNQPSTVPIFQPDPVATGVRSPGVVQHDGADFDVNGASGATGPAVDHPHGSEKYFSITMPSLGINDLTITHPADALSKEGVMEILKDGVGHLFSYPGGGGKIMVYGHSSGYPWDVSEYTKVFRRINELEPGERVYVTYAGTLYVYEITHEQTIIASDTSPFNDDGSGEELILYTCWPPDSIAQRYLVHAIPVETIALR